MKNTYTKNLLTYITFTCSVCTTAGVEGQVRLVDGGSSSCSGTVGIFYKGQWGTICDHGWDLDAAEVACRQLGCGGAVAATSCAYFGEGSGAISWQYIDCKGGESELSQCKHDERGSFLCTHAADAGVICEGKYHFSH